MRLVARSGLFVELGGDGAGIAPRFFSGDGDLVCGADPSESVTLGRAPCRELGLSYETAGQDDGALTAGIRRDDFALETRITGAPDADGFDIRTRLEALKPSSVTRLVQTFLLPSNAPLDYAWVPALHHDPRDVTGDHVFRSPALIARQGNRQVALVPRLSEELGMGPLRTVMDLRPPRLSIGLMDYRPYGHVYYRPTGRPVSVPAGASLELDFTLLFDTDATWRSHQNVVRFLWNACGRKNLDSIGPQDMPFDESARLAYRSIFDSCRLWRGFSLGGADCGGICGRIVLPSLDKGAAPLPEDTTLSVAANYLVTSTLSLRDKAAMLAANMRGIHPHLWNGIFLNNMRTSFGLAWYGRKWKDAELREKARAIWNLALAAPAPRGIFPAVFNADPRHPRWVNGTNIFRYTPAYHTPDAAVTGWWMLAVDRYLEPDAPFRARCAALGDAFAGLQRPSGAVPTWVRPRRDGSLAACAPLSECAGSAAAGMFLAVLAAAGGKPAHLDAARRVADFLIARVFPTQEWFDTEVFYSCSRKPLGWRDPVTGAPPQGTLCLSWAAELFRELHQATGESRYLDYGRAAVDQLLLYQQIWNAPFLSFDTRGGFGVLNTDAEWNDAREACFAPTLLAWYETTGEPELFLRGVAALRAAFTLMHREGEARGAFSENYGHAGRDAHIQGYVMPDWGAGTACSAAALIRARWGDLYIDVPRARAFGIDGCRVAAADFGRTIIALTVERLGDSALDVVCGGTASDHREIRINGARVGRFDAVGARMTLE